MQTSSAMHSPSLLVLTALAASGCVHIRPADGAERTHAAELLHCRADEVRDVTGLAQAQSPSSGLLLAEALSAGGAASASDGASAPAVATAVTVPVVATVATFFAVLDRLKFATHERRNDTRIYSGCGGVVACSDEEGCVERRSADSTPVLDAFAK